MGTYEVHVLKMRKQWHRGVRHMVSGQVRNLTQAFWIQSMLLTLYFSFLWSKDSKHRRNSVVCFFFFLIAVKYICIIKILQFSGINKYIHIVVATITATHLWKFFVFPD